MKYQSTRGAPPVSLEHALQEGIASDGGLFLPVHLPRFDGEDFSSSKDIRETASIFLAPFFEGSSLAVELDEIIAETFDFPVPLQSLSTNAGKLEVLELFHGPTAAFKDFGARFLAACLSRLRADPAHPLTILVATSGDTGGAVAAAFDKRPGIRVVVLYPDGRVSERQAQQLTCWSDNVLSLAVQGSFDDCQAIVKSALADPALEDRYRFTSANSINIGRLLPQCVYYIHASAGHFKATERRPGFIIPTGNLGNAFACFLARATGAPIGRIIMATNANRLIPDFLDGAEWEARKSVETLASAMDVGNPSNMERLRFLGGEADELAQQLKAVSVDDYDITAQINRHYDKFGAAICPHTATAGYVWRQLSDDEKRADDWIIVATAHPAKFERIVEPIIGTSVPVPESLESLLSRKQRFSKIKPDLESLVAAMDEHFGEQPSHESS